jgi:hypothetical protein
MVFWFVFWDEPIIFLCKSIPGTPAWVTRKHSSCLKIFKNYTTLACPCNFQLIIFSQFFMKQLHIETYFVFIILP